MPEYRRVREQHSFLEMCQRPDLAAEVTVTAVERLGVDAAIIFADILLPLVPMGVGLHYESGDGPVIDRPVRTLADLEASRRSTALDVARLRRRFDPAGATRTRRSQTADRFRGRAVYTGLVPDRRRLARANTRRPRRLMYTQPAAWHRLMEMIARVTADYLNMQVDAGADVVQLFDSWVGSLGPDDYRRFVLPHTRAVIAAVRPVSGNPFRHGHRQPARVDA